MPISSIVDGKVLDWKFKKLQCGTNESPVFNFYVGEIFIGQIFKMRRYYSAVSFRDERTSHVYPANGFVSRLKAAEFMLQDSYLQRRVVDSTDFLEQERFAQSRMSKIWKYFEKLEELGAVQIIHDEVIFVGGENVRYRKD